MCPDAYAYCIAVLLQCNQYVPTFATLSQFNPLIHAISQSPADPIIRFSCCILREQPPVSLHRHAQRFFHQETPALPLLAQEQRRGQKRDVHDLEPSERPTVAKVVPQCILNAVCPGGKQNSQL